MNSNIEKDAPVDIYLFTALAPEAKPIVTSMDLKKVPDTRAFTIYRQESLCLTVTGLGKAAMAAGIAYTMAQTKPTAYPVMINIGIAGHHDHTIGTALLAEKIHDTDSGKNFYPQLVADLPCTTITIHTVSQVKEGYQPGWIYDMEASAFFEIAAKFTSAEFIQCLKVISDNHQNPSHTVNAKLAQQLIEQNIDALEKLIDVLQHLRQHIDYPIHPNFDSLTQQIRFSTSEKTRLKKLLNQWDVLTEAKPLDLNPLAFHSGKALINHLQKLISNCKIGL